MMRAYSWLLISLRAVIPLAWIAAAVLATIALPELGSSGSAPLDDLVVQGGQTEQQQAYAIQRFGFPLFTDTAVVARDPRGLPPGTAQKTANAALAVHDHRTPDLPALRAALPITDSSGSPLAPGTDATTAISYLFFADSANLDERTAQAARYGQRYLGGKANAVVGPTGAAPARLAQYNEIESALPLVTVASVVLILLIVGLAFRSIGAPLVTLFAAAIAFLITVRVLPWLGERTGATVPAEVEPIVVVLLLGLVTDYSIFYMSETRRRLRLGEPRLDAARAATARTTPMVLTAGFIVAAGTGALVVGKLGFFRAFGPGLAATTLIALLVSVTLVPALIGLFGTHLFGKSVRREAVEQPIAPADEFMRTREDVHADMPGGRSRWRLALSRPMLAWRRTERLAEMAQTSHWRVLIARVSAARPVALVITVVCLGGLTVLALNTSRMELGLGFVNGLPLGNQVRVAADRRERRVRAGRAVPDRDRPRGSGDRRQARAARSAGGPTAPPAGRRRRDRPGRAARPARAAGAWSRATGTPSGSR